MAGYWSGDEWIGDPATQPGASHPYGGAPAGVLQGDYDAYGQSAIDRVNTANLATRATNAASSPAAASYYAATPYVPLAVPPAPLGTGPRASSPPVLTAPLPPGTATPGAPPAGSLPAGSPPAGVPSTGVPPAGVPPAGSGVPVAGVDPNSDYGKWLAEMRSYAAPDLSAGTTPGSATAQFDTMMHATHAGHYLSPYMQELLRNQVPQAAAGYDIASAVQGNPVPTGAAGSQSMSQYMRDALVSRGDAGWGTSGFGTYASGLPYTRALIDILGAGHAGTGYQGGVNGAPALTAAQTAAIFDRYNTAQGRQTLTQDLGAGVQGPFASYQRNQLGDVTDPTIGGDDFINQLREWERQSYGR